MTRIWTRKTRVLQRSEFPQIKIENYDFSFFTRKHDDSAMVFHDISVYHPKKSLIYDIVTSSKMIWFAGEWIPCIRITWDVPFQCRESLNDPGNRSAFFYTLDSLLEFREQYHLDFQRFFDRYAPIFFKKRAYPDPELGSPIAVVYRGQSMVCEVNPILKDLEFQRVKDPFTAFQEIDHWLSNQSLPENEMVSISDKHKILQHGLDPVYGFRKRKPE